VRRAEAALLFGTSAVLAVVALGLLAGWYR
jgi:hypothetical protein